MQLLTFPTAGEVYIFPKAAFRTTAQAGDSLIGIDGTFLNLTLPHMPAIKKVADIWVFSSQPSIELGMPVGYQDGHNQRVGLKNAEGPLEAFQLHMIAAPSFIGLKETNEDNMKQHKRNKICQFVHLNV